MSVRCAFCGSDLDSYPCLRCGALEADAQALQEITVDTWKAQRALKETSARLDALAEARRRLFRAVDGRRPIVPSAEAPQVEIPPRPDVVAPRPARPAPSAAQPHPAQPVVTSASVAEWRPQSIGAMLLLLGVILLALAALVFAVVAWPRLDDTQRAFLLAGATVLAGALAAGLRSRLPSTSEALSGLFLLMLAIDWVAIRRAGVGSDLDLTLWWAMGSTIVGMAALVVGSSLRQRIPRTACVGIFAVSAVLWIFWASDSLRFRASGAAVVAAALVLAASLFEKLEKRNWYWSYLTALSAAALLECAALATAAVNSSTATWGEATASAGMALAVALPPVLARTSLKTRWGMDAGLVFLAAAEIFVAVEILLAVSIHGGDFVAVSTVLAVGLLAIARVGPSDLRLGVGTLGAGVAAVACVPATFSAGEVVASAMALLEDPWGPSGAQTATADLVRSFGAESMVFPGDRAWVLIVALSVVGASLVACAPWRGKPELAAPAIGYAFAVLGAFAFCAVFPVWAGWTVALAVVCCAASAAAALLVAARFDRGRAEPGLLGAPTIALVWLAVLTGSLGVAWGAAARATTLFAVGVVAVGSIAATTIFRSTILRATGSAIGVAAVGAEAGLVVLAADGSWGWALTVMCCAASSLAVLVAWGAPLAAARSVPFPTTPALAMAALLAATGVVATAGLWGETSGWPLVVSTAAAGIAAFAVAFAPGLDELRAALVAIGVAAVGAEAGLVVLAADGSWGWALTAMCCAASSLAVLVAWGAPLAAARSVPFPTTPALAMAALLAATGVVATAGLWGETSGWPLVVSTAAAGIAAFAVAFAPGLDEPRAALVGVAATALVALSAEIPGARDAGLASVGWSVGAVSAPVFLAGVHLLRRDEMAQYVEGVGLIGLLGSLMLQFGAAAPIDSASVSGPAAAATAAVPVLAAGAVRQDRRIHAALAGASALLAVWLWLASAEVDLWEAYTLPAAALALVVGFVMRRTPAGERSWAAYGPGLVLAFAPTLFLVLRDGDTLRWELLAIAATVAVFVGAALRLQAPMVMGSLTLVILGVDLLWPVVVRAERWVVLALAGAAFVWLGATIEKRLREVRRLRHTLEGMR